MLLFYFKNAYIESNKKVALRNDILEHFENACLDLADYDKQFSRRFNEKDCA